MHVSTLVRFWVIILRFGPVRCVYALVCVCVIYLVNGNSWHSCVCHVRHKHFNMSSPSWRRLKISILLAYTVEKAKRTKKNTESRSLPLEIRWNIFLSKKKEIFFSRYFAQESKQNDFTFWFDFYVDATVCVCVSCDKLLPYGYFFSLLSIRAPWFKGYSHLYRWILLTWRKKHKALPLSARWLNDFQGENTNRTYRKSEECVG